MMKNGLRREIGLQIAKLRVEKGMTQLELAEKCGINNSNLSKIERGAYNVGVDIVEKLITALDAEIRINKK